MKRNYIYFTYLYIYTNQFSALISYWDNLIWAIEHNYISLRYDHDKTTYMVQLAKQLGILINININI